LKARYGLDKETLERFMHNQRGACAICRRQPAAHGQQARDDGAVESDNVLGDMMEALIGAQYLDGGPDAARDLIHRLWGKCLGDQAHATQHPKSALQEWAAANNRKPPLYELLGRSGPQHAPTFIVKVAVKGVGEARGEGPTKQEAETEAAPA
jgi:ribonuclease-3